MLQSKSQMTLNNKIFKFSESMVNILQYHVHTGNPCRWKLMLTPANIGEIELLTRLHRSSSENRFPRHRHVTPGYHTGHVTQTAFCRSGGGCEWVNPILLLSICYMYSFWQYETVWVGVRQGKRLFKKISLFLTKCEPPPNCLSWPEEA